MHIYKSRHGTAEYKLHEVCHNNNLLTLFLLTVQCFKTIQEKWYHWYFFNYYKSIYIMISSVKYANGTTEFFTCPNGLKQGCILSPMLFSLLVQEITSEIRNHGGYGIQFTPDIVELSILLFADGIVLIADIVFELQ